MADPTFRDVIAEALALAVKATGFSPDELFGDGLGFGRTDLGGEAAWSTGYLEGAASALDVTVLEMLDSLDLWPVE